MGISCIALFKSIIKCKMRETLWKITKEKDLPNQEITIMKNLSTTYKLYSIIHKWSYVSKYAHEDI